MWMMWVGGVGLSLLTACQRLDRRTAPSVVSGTGPAALHAVQSERLKSVMARLSVLGFERLPQEMSENNRRAAQLEKASETALAMAEAAKQIHGALDDLSLEPADQRVFRALADRLRGQAVELGSRTRRGDVSGSNSSLKEINATCVACHTLFRSTPKL
jgi:cytochrome c556